MGVLIIAEQPPVTSTYDQWKVYRASTKTGLYVLQVTQAITDLTYYDITGVSTSWYKITYYKSTATTAESDLSDPIQGQTTNYTTVKKVESFLQKYTTSDTTNPSVQEIVEIINRKEDIIDRKTGHAWRLRYSGTESGKDQTAKYEMYDLDGPHEYHTGIPIYLKHRKIKALSAADGDALEYFNGSTYEDWIATKQEGRGLDFWIDYEAGILYVYGYWTVRKPLAIRIKYRWGDEYVDLGIEDIATKMAAVDVLTGMDPRTMIVQESSPTMTHGQRIEKWEAEIEERLTTYKEFQMPSRCM